MKRQDEIWKKDPLVETYLKEVRGGIPFAAEQIDIIIRVIEARGEPIERFADLGCGNGVLSVAILTKYPDASGTLVDFSEPMIEKDQSQLAQYAYHLRFVISDFGKKGWEMSISNNGPFDAIVSGYSIHHQPDDRKQQLYREIFELLKPGGIFVNIEHVASPTDWIASISDCLFIDSLYAFHSRKESGKSREEISDEFFHRPDKEANILAPVESQLEWLREYGFEDVDCYFKVFELAIFGGRRPKR